MTTVNPPCSDTLAILAQRYHLAREHVNRIYDAEHSRLQRHARITLYTPLLALSRTRDRLKACGRCTRRASCSGEPCCLAVH